MEAYTSFAYVYDTFMDNVPYGEWARHIREKLCEHGVTDWFVLDLGCGTGTMTERLAGYGYDMIGVDNSEEMLELAMEKKTESGYDILYLLQDMRGFELYGTVRAVVSVCDSVNYITEPDELEEVFRLVNNYLDPKGIFLFDFNTVHKYRDVIGDSTIAEDRGVCSFIWDNMFQKERQIRKMLCFQKKERVTWKILCFQKKRVAKTEVYIGDIRRRIIKEGIRLPRYKNFWNVQVLYL